MIKANYHTHTTRCGHAVGTDRDYVEAAVSAGYTILGFSDHVPWPYRNGFTHRKVRMIVGQMDGYLRSIRALREEYRDSIRIYAGFECEYFPEYMDWLRDMKERAGLDYLILGNHFDTTDDGGMYFGNMRTAEQLRRYTELTCRGLETGLFRYLAHPDLFMRSYPAYDENVRAASRDLCQCCRELGIPVEYNLHDRFIYPVTRRISYPTREFFEMAREMGLEVIVGIDAHDPEELRDSTQWDRAQQELKDYGDQLIRVLPGLD